MISIGSSRLGLIVGGLALASVVLGSFYTVDEKERGVVLRNGAFVAVAEPGLAFKLPIFEKVKFISVQNNTTRYEQLQAYSKDQQAAGLNVSVSWHVEPGQVADLYRGYGDLETMVSRLISRQVPTQVENVFGRYTAINAVQNRGQFVADIAAAIKAEVKGPVVIDGVQIENIDFSDAYEKSIEERMRAEVQVKTREQMLATEKVQAEIRVTQANAEAEAKLAQARADAEATRLRGDAEASAIRARAEALASNQNLVELTKAERWNGVLPTTVLPNNSVPFIDAGK
ncbi:Modulator of FtsH protease HflC [compost metagenome]